MEAKTTKKMLKLVPANKLEWRPHVKSMTMRQLSTHVAELPGWIHMTLTTDGIDFAGMDFKPAEVKGSEDLLVILEKALGEGRSALEKATEADLQPDWTIRTGSTIHTVVTRYEMIRHAMSQIIHHRAQLGVYLRLLDIPIPGSYGPSADEQKF